MDLTTANPELFVELARSLGRFQSKEAFVPSSQVQPLSPSVAGMTIAQNTPPAPPRQMTRKVDPQQALAALGADSLAPPQMPVKTETDQTLLASQQGPHEGAHKLANADPYARANQQVEGALQSTDPNGAQDMGSEIKRQVLEAMHAAGITKNPKIMDSANQNHIIDVLHAMSAALNAHGIRHDLPPKPSEEALRVEELEKAKEQQHQMALHDAKAPISSGGGAAGAAPAPPPRMTGKPNMAGLGAIGVGGASNMGGQKTADDATSGSTPAGSPGSAAGSVAVGDAKAVNSTASPSQPGNSYFPTASSAIPTPMTSTSFPQPPPLVTQK